MRHTATHVVVATGADPFTPPITGLRELSGVWGSREATSMKVVPRHLLVLGGGHALIPLPTRGYSATEVNTMLR